MASFGDLALSSFLASLSVSTPFSSLATLVATSMSSAARKRPVLARGFGQRFQAHHIAFDTDGELLLGDAGHVKRQRVGLVVLLDAASVGPRGRAACKASLKKRSSERMVGT